MVRTEEMVGQRLVNVHGRAGWSVRLMDKSVDELHVMGSRGPWDW